MGYSKMRIFWQESVTFMKFLPKAVKSKLRLVRFLKKKLNVAKKSLHVVTFTSKSMISSKVKACGMQNLQGTWKFPCITQAIYLTCKHLARYMEISMYFAMCFIARYMENSMYLATKDMQGTWKFPCILQRNIWQGTWKFPCTLQRGKIW